jgi:hypothetical protein
MLPHKSFPVNCRRATPMGGIQTSVWLRGPFRCPFDPFARDPATRRLCAPLRVLRLRPSRCKGSQRQDAHASYGHADFVRLARLLDRCGDVHRVAPQVIGKRLRPMTPATAGHEMDADPQAGAAGPQKALPASRPLVKRAACEYLDVVGGGLGHAGAAMTQSSLVLIFFATVPSHEIVRDREKSVVHHHRSLRSGLPRAAELPTMSARAR